MKNPGLPPAPPPSWFLDQPLGVIALVTAVTIVAAIIALCIARPTRPAIPLIGIITATACMVTGSMLLSGPSPERLQAQWNHKVTVWISARYDILTTDATVQSMWTSFPQPLMGQNRKLWWTTLAATAEGDLYLVDTKHGNTIPADAGVPTKKAKKK